MRNAISYWVMRVAISGSPMSANCTWSSWPIASMRPRRSFRGLWSHASQCTALPVNQLRKFSGY